MIHPLMLMPGPTELLIIAGIVMLIWGGKKLPELMGGLGKGIKEFKRGVLYDEDDLKDDIEKGKIE